MKMKKNLLFAILIWSLPSINLFAQSNPSEQITIPLSNPQESGTLIIKHYKGSIKVTGYEGNSIIVSAQLRHPVQDKTVDGFRKINSSFIQLKATEQKNSITVSTNSHEKTIDLVIQVPSNFSLNLHNYDNGKIEIIGLTGEMDINNENGAISIIHLRGSAVLNTIDGHIKVVFDQVKPNVPMSFSSLEGNIDLTFPALTHALLKMKSDHGDIFTDFDISVNAREQKVEKLEFSATNKIFLDRWIYGQLNGGGPEFLLKTFNGNLYIRKNSN